METKLLLLCVLIGLIHFISTLSYGIRIAGVRTGRLALCLALFNVLVLFSRSSNSILAPLLSKRIEAGAAAAGTPPVTDFRLLLAAATAGTLVAAFFIPTFQRFAVISVSVYERKRSMLALLWSVTGRTFWRALGRSVTMPRRANLQHFYQPGGIPRNLFCLNVLGIGMISTGVFCSLYAGMLDPALRLTAGNLSAAVNMGGTLILFGLVDPHFSFLSDRVVAGEQTDPEFRRAVSAMTSSRVVGTLFGQVLLVPGALLIVWIARLLPS